MGTLKESLDDYLQLRRNLGYKLADAARLLPRFVSWMEENGRSTVTIHNAIEWCQLQPAQPGSTVWPRRMTAVRGFARYLTGIDSAAQVPPIGLFPSRRQWRPPFIFTADNIAALMEAAGYPRLHTPLSSVFSRSPGCVSGKQSSWTGPMSIWRLVSYWCGSPSL